MIRSLMSLLSNLSLGKNKREFILHFFLSLLDSHSYALIDNWSQFCFLLVISDFWLYKEKKLSVHFHTSAPTLAPLLQMAQRREVNFAFFTLLSYCPRWNVLQRWERGRWWPLRYILPPALFNRCENGREAGREAVMRDTVQFDLAWYIVLRCWGPHWCIDLHINDVRFYFTFSKDVLKQGSHVSFQSANGPFLQPPLWGGCPWLVVSWPSCPLCIPWCDTSMTFFTLSPSTVAYSVSTPGGFYLLQLPCMAG